MGGRVEPQAKFGLWAWVKSLIAQSRTDTNDATNSLNATIAFPIG